MKHVTAKLGIFALACTLGAAAFSPVSAEQPSILNTSAQTTVSSGSASTAVGMIAEFIPGATFKVDYANPPLDYGNAAHRAPPAPDINHLVTREAHITIGGMPGETVFLTCDVKAENRQQRDCGGGSAIEQHEIMSGQKLDDGILLTDDLMPNDTGVSEGIVTFEVSYI